MANVIELESSYILKENYNDILIKIKELDFKFYEHILEEDTYYTDKEETFIKNRVCLRTRKTNNEKLELTYKPKTDNSTEKYGKKEINISLNVDDYDDVKYMINELGYIEYVSFIKDRTIYTKLIDGFIHNIMIDNIENVGNYIEFEILANTEDEKEKLKASLEKFIQEFNCKNLQEQLLPYRDIVKQNLTK